MINRLNHVERCRYRGIRPKRTPKQRTSCCISMAAPPGPRRKRPLGWWGRDRLDRRLPYGRRRESRRPQSDYFIKRSLKCTVDFTGDTPKPMSRIPTTIPLPMATGASDYHTYARILAPVGSKCIDQSRRHTGGVIGQDSTDPKNGIRI